MRLRLVLTALVLLVSSPALAQEVELQSCLPDPTACFETSGELVSQSCGEAFYFHRGRVSWPALEAVGPITISVLSRTITGDNPLPLYVQIVIDVDSTGCSTGDSIAFPLITTRGLPQCGGVWESIGPIDITQFVPIGGLYRIQLEFLEGGPVPFVRSPAVACVRVEVDNPVLSSIQDRDWSAVKALYR